MIVIAWFYDYDCLIFIKCSDDKKITWYYDYYMALYDESVREWSYMIVIAWCYDYDCLIFIKCSDDKNITSDYGYHYVRLWLSHGAIWWHCKRMNLYDGYGMVLWLAYTQPL